MHTCRQSYCFSKYNTSGSWGECWYTLRTESKRVLTDCSRNWSLIKISNLKSGHFLPCLSHLTKSAPYPELWPSWCSLIMTSRPRLCRRWDVGRKILSRRHINTKTQESEDREVQSCPVPHPWDRENYRSTLRFKDGLVVQNKEKVKRWAGVWI